MAIEVLFDHPLFRIEGDGVHTRMWCRDWVNVLPLTGDGQAVLIRQPRFGTGTETLEIPGGIIDPGEDPLVAAQRELAEETGYGGGAWRSLGWVHPNPAIQTNRCFLFVADGVAPIGPQRLDPLEDIAIDLHPIDRLGTLVTEGAIDHALVVLAIQRWMLERATTG
jgi:8-oxo-dGTP pyrophosphatase MutT (NUDIX family)